MEGQHFPLEAQVRHLRVAAAWQQGLPAPGSDPSASAWRFDAACANYDPDLFFPVGSTGTAQRQTQQAKAVCAGCPVRLQCLQWALDTDQQHGVWGGLDELERARMQAHPGAEVTPLTVRREEPVQHEEPVHHDEPLHARSA